jgi:5,10-methylene-tetrahydrofolate dehydrogenase/methenyl tetrahydrofolate cyclohydrolase
MHANATVTICHSKTQNLADIVRQADIIVAAIGRTALVTGDMVSRVRSSSTSGQIKSRIVRQWSACSVKIRFAGRISRSAATSGQAMWMN